MEAFRLDFVGVMTTITPAFDLNPYDLPEESWVPISGFEAFYEVSTLGRIRSHDSRSRRPKSFILVQNANSSGYLHVKLCRKKVQRTIMTHLLVAHHFLEPDPLRSYVNHKDGHKFNNTLDNVEWCTASENQQHRYRNGLGRKQ